MSTWIALLRGIGGGIRSLEMKPLVRALEGIGLTDVRTYIATGNVVFTSDKTAAQLSKAIEQRIADKFGFAPTTFVLSRPQLLKAAKENPYPAADDNPKSLHLFFLAAPAKQAKLDAMNEIKLPHESFTLKGKVFYLHTPEGFGQSKLAERVERLLGVPTTARNWRTIGKVLEMSKGI